MGRSFGAMQTFREWTFGRYVALRQPQPADLSEDRLLPDSRNLALVLNQIEHTGGVRFDDLLRRFFPRFQRMSTRVLGGTVQFYLHESGFTTPIPATRLSDGTIRFVALLATLLSPSPPPLVCIEEPELGLHPDAVALLADLLIEASDRMQLVVTTHSDVLVSALNTQPEAVIACERPGAGTQLRRLEAEKLASWLDKYRLGDLWRMGRAGSQPVSVAIYMEGGGDGGSTKAALRQGMDAMLKQLKQAAREKAMRWQLVCCGPRQEAFLRFRDAVRNGNDTVVVLLVDAEGPVEQEPRGHLLSRDGWNLNFLNDDAVHLMVQTMETWIVADPEALGEYYGQNFQCWRSAEEAESGGGA